MPTFKYVAIDPGGNRMSGLVDGTSMVTARDDLISRELSVVKLSEHKPWYKAEITKKKLRPLDVMNFSRQLAAFLRAGIPILEALRSLSEDASNPRLRQVLVETSDALRAGSSFADALAQHSAHFPSYYIGIVRSAELTGNLDIVLEQLAGYMERDEEAKRAVKSALIYPFVILIMSIITVVVLTSYVLPRFEKFFRDLNAKLPLPTRMLLSFSNFLSNWWWLIVAIIVIVGLGSFLYHRTDRGRRDGDRLLLSLPALGIIVRYAIVERFCRILAAMLESGVPMPDGLAAAANSSNNVVYHQALTTVREQVMSGQGVAEPLAATHLFPAAAIQMVRVGEESGTLDKQLSVAADFYASELNYKLKRFTALFEPAVIIAMGVMVGFVAVALISAMYGIFNQENIG